MPFYRLQFKAELENIAALTVVPGNSWRLDLESGGERREGVYVTSTETHEIEGSR